MKNRPLPYGYRFIKGCIAIHEQEQAILTEIYDRYLSGKSLLNITEELNARNVEFMPGTIGWNKARLKRILEDERYLGNDNYPALVDKETYDTIQKIKDSRNTQKAVNRKADIFQIAVPVKCPMCGSEMHRRSDKRSKCSERWTCRKDDCRKVIVISDKELLGRLTELLNSVIAAPESIIIPKPAAKEQSLELRRLNNEIDRAIEGFSIQKEALRKKFLRSVALKYASIDNTVYTAKQLKADLTNASPLSDFSSDLFNRTVSEVQFIENGEVCIILTNGQQIRKEQSDGSTRNTATATSGTQDRANH